MDEAAIDAEIQRRLRPEGTRSTQHDG